MEDIFILHHFSKMPHQNTQGTDCTVLKQTTRMQRKKSEFYGRLQAVVDQKAKTDDNIGKELVIGRRALVR